MSRSGYYTAQSHAQQPARICTASVQLKAAFAASGRCYGSGRLQASLCHQGLQIGRYRVRRLMKRHGLRASWRRKFVHTTDSKHDLPVAQNVLNRQFEPAQPNQAWVCDITYIRTRSGWLYLAAVLDLYSRKLVGWAIAASTRAKRIKLCWLSMVCRQA